MIKHYTIIKTFKSVAFPDCFDWGGPNLIALTTANISPDISLNKVTKCQTAVISVSE